jgi:hypothetical protein
MPLIFWKVNYRSCFGILGDYKAQARYPSRIWTLQAGICREGVFYVPTDCFHRRFR